MVTGFGLSVQDISIGWSSTSIILVGTKHLFCRDKTKIILMAAPAYDRTRVICTWRSVLVKLVPSDVVEAKCLELHGPPFCSMVRHSYGNVPTHRYRLNLI